MSLDVEGALRTWTRDVLDPAKLARRVFFDVPESGTLPLVTIERLGGAPDPGEIPLEYPRITFKVWARSKDEARRLSGDLTDLLGQMRNTKVGDVALRGATVDSVLWLPDKDSGLARYIVDATVTVAPA